MIYQHPTINALAMYVLELAQNHGAVAAESVSHARVQAIEDMIRKYSLPEPAPPASSDTAHASRAPVVILTGSTGHLGAHILQQLLRNPRVERVYALNRVSPAGGRAIASRHADRFRDLGLDEQLLLSATLVHIETDTAAARLGLSDVLYEEVRTSRSVACIIVDEFVCVGPFYAAVRPRHRRRPPRLGARLQLPAHCVRGARAGHASLTRPSARIGREVRVRVVRGRGASVGKVSRTLP